MHTIHLVAGARPNFMKIAPLVRAMDARRGEIGYKAKHPSYGVVTLHRPWSSRHHSARKHRTADHSQGRYQYRRAMNSGKIEARH